MSITKEPKTDKKDNNNEILKRRKKTTNNNSCSNKNSLDTFLKETFTPEFLKKCEIEYHKAEVEGLKHQIDELEKQNSELRHHIENLTSELALMCVAVIDGNDPPDKYTYKAMAIMHREQIEYENWDYENDCPSRGQEYKKEDNDKKITKKNSNYNGCRTCSKCGYRNAIGQFEAGGRKCPKCGNII